MSESNIESIENLKALGEKLDRVFTQLNTFFELSVDLLAIANQDGYYVKLSKSWETTTGFTREELMSRPFYSFLCSKKEAESTQSELKKISKDNSTVDFTNCYLTKSGEHVILQWRSTQVDDLIYAIARVID